MTEKKYHNKYNALLKRERILMISCGILALALGVQSFATYKLSASQKTVFLPPFPIEKEVWVHGNQVSFSYLETMGKLIANTLLNINPRTAQEQLYSLLVFVAPDKYAEFKSEFQKQIAHYVDNELSTVFYPSQITAKDDTIVVVGQMREIVGDKVLRGGYLELWISYKILDNGKFEFTNLERKNEKTNH